jgi:hypothetical protein
MNKLLAYGLLSAADFAQTGLKPAEPLFLPE